MPIPNQFTKTSELDKRFNIGKNTRVNRLAMLGLTSDRLTKQGRYYLLNPEQLELFTEFDKYILETGSSDGYPKLLSAHSDNPITSDLLTEKHVRTQVLDVDKVVQGQNQVDCDTGQLTVTKQDLENLLNLVPEESDIFSSFTGEFTGTLHTNQVDHGLTHRVKANAQSRAIAILIAEHTLAEQYIACPDMLDPALRAQLDDVQPIRIDPKKLAASLVFAATGQQSMIAA
jgi:hypothetical protein